MHQLQGTVTQEQDVTALVRSIDRLTLELSNLCNYTKIHDKCPASCVREPNILPARTVLDALDVLARYGFGAGKFLAFHVYNEPLLDPRLLSFVTYARARMPGLNIILWSNGWYLYETIAVELIHAGVTHLSISGYTDREQSRFLDLRDRLKEKLAAIRFEGALPVYFRVMRMRELDDRLMSPDKREDDTATHNEPCYQPTSDLIIWSSGHIGLCCFDWQHNETFGNVLDHGFEAALLSGREKLTARTRELQAGIRTLPICKTCVAPRGPANGRAQSRWNASKRIWP